MGEKGGKDKRILLNPIPGLTENAQGPWPCPALPGAVQGSDPSLCARPCPGAATAPGDSSTSDRSCQALQQVLMMDGINEIIFEV